MTDEKKQRLHKHNTMALPASPRKAVEEMIAIVTNIQKLYVAENQSLDDSNIQDFLQLQPLKLSLAQRYESGIHQIIKRKDEMKDVEPHLKNKLQIMQRDFTQLANKNRSALERMQRITARLGETIRSAAKDVVENRIATGYSAEGAMQRHKKGNMSVGISETA